MRRLVTGKFYKTDDTPWTNLSISFKREKSSYTSGIHYPTDFIKAQTDNEGNLFSTESSQGVFLWVNQEGDVSSVYTAYLPHCETFNFSLPPGDGSPIELSVLRQDYVVDATSMTYTTLVNYVDTQVANATLGNSQFVVSNNYEAAEPISAAKVVSLDNTGKIVLADIDISSTVFSVLGISRQAITLGAIDFVVISGEFEDASFSLTPNLPVFLGNSGNLIQNPDQTKPYLITIGTAITTTKILLNIEKPIKLN